MKSECVEWHASRPDNWNTTDPQWAGRWLAAHVAAAKDLGKPLALEEVLNPL